MEPPPAEATTSNVGPRRSTLFLPGGGRRIESPAQIMDSGCPCAAGSKFAQWLNLDCDIGHFIVTNNTIFDSLNQVIPIVLHSLKFKLLSACRASPIEPINILRGVIDGDSLGTLRVAGTAEDYLKPLSAEPSSTPEAWDMTDKHRVLWLLPTRDLHVATVTSAIGKGKGKGKASAKGNNRCLLGDVDNARATKLWQDGSLHFAMSAPRSVIGRWRMSFVPPVPAEFAGEVVCLTLEWVGNKFFHHECLRRAMNAPTRTANIGVLGPLFLRDAAPTDCMLTGVLSEAAIHAYEDCRKFVLDDEQRKVLHQINTSTRQVIFIQASAGVGKTSVLDCVVSALISAEPADVSNMVLILVPNRELRHDICQDLLACVLQREQLLWLGRPPPGRSDGLWDDILEERIKEKQRDVWIKLGHLKKQLADNLKTFREHSLRDGNWNFIQDVYFHDDMHDDLRITPYLDALWAAKLTLRDHILMEVEGLLKPRNSIITELGMPVQVAVATADAYTKFLSKNAKCIGAKFLKTKKLRWEFLMRLSHMSSNKCWRSLRCQDLRMHI